jgi:hypothetical protein
MGLRDASPTQGRDNRVMYNRGGARVVMVCQFRTGSCVDHAAAVNPRPPAAHTSGDPPRVGNLHHGAKHDCPKTTARGSSGFLNKQFLKLEL